MKQPQTSPILIISTAPDALVAENLAKQLVENKLAACVNLLPKIKSIYSWQNNIESSEEVLMTIKTSKKHFSAIERFLEQEHPYEVPEIISCNIEQISKPYGDWLAAHLKS